MKCICCNKELKGNITLCSYCNKILEYNVRLLRAIWYVSREAMKYNRWR